MKQAILILVLLTTVIFANAQIVGKEKDNGQKKKRVGNAMLYYANGIIIAAEDDHNPQYSEVKSLVWQSMGMKQIPQELYNYANIEVLDISHNQIAYLDASAIQKFKKLKRLYINGNPLDVATVAKLRKELSGVEVIFEKNEKAK